MAGLMTFNEIWHEDIHVSRNLEYRNVCRPTPTLFGSELGLTIRRPVLKALTSSAGFPLVRIMSVMH